MGSLDCDICCTEANVGSSTRESKECLLLRRYKCCRLGEGDEREDRSATSRNEWSKGFWFDSDTRIANKDRTRTSVLVSSCLSRSIDSEQRSACFPGSGKFEFGFLLLDCTDAKTTIDCKQRICLRRYKCCCLGEGDKREDRSRTNLWCWSCRLCSSPSKVKRFHHPVHSNATDSSPPTKEKIDPEPMNGLTRESVVVLTN